jgi:hypothetical protein
LGRGYGAHEVEMDSAKELCIRRWLG